MTLRYGVLAFAAAHLLAGGQARNGNASSPEPTPKLLTHVNQIRRLTPDQARKGFAVRLRAVVTYFDTVNMFVHDATGGIWVARAANGLTAQPGQLLDLQGVTTQTDFAPDIAEPRWSVQSAMPPCRRPCRSPWINWRRAPWIVNGWDWKEWFDPLRSLKTVVSVSSCKYRAGEWWATFPSMQAYRRDWWILAFGFMVFAARFSLRKVKLSGWISLCPALRKSRSWKPDHATPLRRPVLADWKTASASTCRCLLGASPQSAGSGDR